MNIKEIEKLAAVDAHGVYQKPDGSTAVLPIKRHFDWVSKGMELIERGENHSAEYILKKIEKQKREKEKKSKELLEKYGASLADDIPELFRNLKSAKKKSTPAKPKSPSNNQS